jgi:hypothetical protein
MQSARVLIAARPDEGFVGLDQVRKLAAGWGPFTVSLAEPYCMFGASSQPQEGEDIEDPDEVQEPQEQPVAPKARRGKRTKAA